MGQRKVEVPDGHTHAPVSGEVQISVPAEKIIERLRQQRANLQAQLDIVETALGEQQEQNRHLLARIDELEAK